MIFYLIYQAIKAWQNLFPSQVTNAAPARLDLPYETQALQNGWHPEYFKDVA